MCCDLDGVSIQIPAPDQGRFFDSAELEVAVTTTKARRKARWMRTLRDHPWAEVLVLIVEHRFLFVFFFVCFFLSIAHLISHLLLIL
jgi:hypothetical protein